MAKGLFVKAKYDLRYTVNEKPTFKTISGDEVQYSDKHVHALQPKPKDIQEAKDNCVFAVGKECKKLKIDTPTNIEREIVVETFSKK